MKVVGSAGARPPGGTPTGSLVGEDPEFSGTETSANESKTQTNQSRNNLDPFNFSREAFSKGTVVAIFAVK